MDGRVRNSSSRDDDPTDGVASCFARVSVQRDEANAEKVIKEEAFLYFVCFDGGVVYGCVVSDCVVYATPAIPRSGKGVGRGWIMSTVYMRAARCLRGGRKKEDEGCVLGGVMDYLVLVLLLRAWEWRSCWLASVKIGMRKKLERKRLGVGKMPGMFLSSMLV